MRLFFSSVLMLVQIIAFPAASHGPTEGGKDMPTEEICLLPGDWYEVATGRTIAQADAITGLASHPVVLLGEAHSSAEHHRWQLHTIAALHARNPDMVLGFEAFPRRLQPVLDRWAAGELDRGEFLEAVEWNRVWRYHPDLYMPLFHFARMHRLRMVALNVDIDLIRKVRKEGWPAITEAERQGIGDPVAPGEAYLDSLAAVFAHHREMEKGGHHGRESDDAGNDDPPEAVDRGDPAFRRFVAAQLTWDRAMAEALADAPSAEGRPLVVGIVGGGHVEYGYGIPHQLADLGVTGAAVALPWDEGRGCTTLKSSDGTAVAGFVFGIDAPGEPEKPAKPLLGVFITDKDGGVHVDGVMPDSVARNSGLKKGDLIVEAAGVATARTQDLIAIVQRQAAGTWLPLKVERDDDTIDIIARFPPKP